MFNIYKSVIVLTLLASTNLSSIGDVTYIRPPEAQNSPIQSSESLVIEYLGEHMLPTLQCESGLKQFNPDGTIITSRTNDVGIAQVNLKVWGKKAEELGYDLTTTIGNLKMAKYVYTVQGPEAWVCYRILSK